MSEIIITGKITEVLEAKSGTSTKTGNAWKSQQYVMEIPGQYPKHVCFDVFGDDKISKFNIEKGKSYNVSIDIDAKEYKGKWYNQLRAWKVEEAQEDAAGTTEPPKEPSPETQKQAEIAFADDADETGDLPF